MSPDFKGVLKILFLYLLLIALCRVTKGAAVFLLPLVAAYYMTRRRMGPVLLSYMMIPLLANTNGALLGGGLFGLASRVSTLAITLLLMMQSTGRRGRHRIPLGGLYAFLVIACISSISGWFPMISYLKVMNFLVFLIGLHIGTRNLHHHPEELMLVRRGLLALAVVYVIGSAFSYYVPAIGYSMEISNMRVWGAQGSNEELAQQLLERGAEGGMVLFSGLTNHSQALAPTVAAFAAWVLCDALFCVRKFDVLHLAILGFAPVVLFMTRSRVGLLGFVVALTVVFLFALPHAHVPRSVRRKFTGAMFGFAILLLTAALVSEARNNAMSRWIRKTEDVGDERSLSEAVTSTRQGAIEANMYDFYQNPLFGMGFQVEPDHPFLYQTGRITLFSAPIEKGVLPLMVLGETGIVGLFAFVCFLIVFFNTCIRKKYIVTASLFAVMLALNMGEATFFSPAAVGGVIWILAAAGGFVIDMYCVGATGGRGGLLAQRFSLGPANATYAR